MHLQILCIIFSLFIFYYYQYNNLYYFRLLNKLKFSIDEYGIMESKLTTILGKTLEEFGIIDDHTIILKNKQILISLIFTL